MMCRLPFIGREGREMGFVGMELFGPCVPMRNDSTRQMLAFLEGLGSQWCFWAHRQALCCDAFPCSERMAEHLSKDNPASVESQLATCVFRVSSLALLNMETLLPVNRCVNANVQHV